jgi:hypothetical protein
MNPTRNLHVFFFSVARRLNKACHHDRRFACAAVAYFKSEVAAGASVGDTPGRLIKERRQLIVAPVNLDVEALKQSGAETSLDRLNCISSSAGSLRTFDMPPTPQLRGDQGCF